MAGVVKNAGCRKEDVGCGTWSAGKCGQPW